MHLVFSNVKFCFFSVLTVMCISLCTYWLLTLLSYYSKEKQGDEASGHLCFPSHISSMEQESSSYLDGKFSCLFELSITGELFSSFLLCGLLD